MDEREQLFCDICRNYGFDPDDYEVEFDTFAGEKTKLKPVKLVGFEGERCLLEIQHKNPSRKAPGKRVYVRELPSDVMRHIRLYYRDLADKSREDGLMAACQMYTHMANKWTNKLKRAGHEADPTAIFNAWGNPENAKLNIAEGKKYSGLTKYWWKVS